MTIDEAKEACSTMEHCRKIGLVCCNTDRRSPILPWFGAEKLPLHIEGDYLYIKNVELDYAKRFDMRLILSHPKQNAKVKYEKESIKIETCNTEALEYLTEDGTWKNVAEYILGHGTHYTYDEKTRNNKVKRGYQKTYTFFPTWDIRDMKDWKDYFTDDREGDKCLMKYGVALDNYLTERELRDALMPNNIKYWRSEALKLRRMLKMGKYYSEEENKEVVGVSSGLPVDCTELKKAWNKWKSSKD